MRATPISILAAGLLTAAPFAASVRAEERAPASVAAPDRATLTVVGTAAVERAPDVAHLLVTLRTRGPALDAVARDHRARAARAAAVLDRLEAVGVRVEAGSFDLAEEPSPAPVSASSPGRPAPAAPTFRAETGYDLVMPFGAGQGTGRGTGQGAGQAEGPGPGLDAAVAELAASGLFEVGSLRFAVADGAGALDEARRAAATDAKRQAQVYADALGLRLDAIDRVMDGAAEGASAAPFAVSMRAKAAPPSVGLRAPASLSFSGSVTVVWHVAPR